MKIVIFEDEKLLRDMYEVKLRASGFDTVSFEYPPENVVDIVAKEKPDLISMGVMMPNMDGFAAAKLLKADQRTKDIPLVFLTGLSQEQDIKVGMELGAVDYLVKQNHSPSDVVEKFKKIIAKHYNEGKFTTK